MQGTVATTRPNEVTMSDEFDGDDADFVVQVGDPCPVCGDFVVDEIFMGDVIDCPKCAARLLVSDNL